MSRDTMTSWRRIEPVSQEITSSAEPAALKRTLRLALVVHSLRAGGAERVASTLANHWVGTKKDVTLVTFDPVSTDFYKLDSRINRASLNAAYKSANRWQVIRNFIRRTQQLRRFLRLSQFDLVLSLGDKTNVQVLMAAFHCRTKIILAEHNDPRKHKLGMLPSVLRRLCYPRADALVVLTAGMRDCARRMVRARPVYVVPNPLSDDFVGHFPIRAVREQCRVLAMGRLTPQKGFDLLLEAFARCAKTNPAWTLRIIGEGEESSFLHRISCELGIDTKVEFRGITKHPQLAMQEADLFVLPSRYEGFPMVLLEALASGLPAISFDCMSGPREMIHNGVNGILVSPGNVSELAKAMDKLMGNANERGRLASHGAEICERYCVEAISARWDAIFNETLGNDDGTRLFGRSRIQKPAYYWC